MYQPFGDINVLINKNMYGDVRLLIATSGWSQYEISIRIVKCYYCPIKIAPFISSEKSK